MRAAVISIGDELLIGKIVNTNSQYISRALCENGLQVLYQFTLADNEEQIVETLDLLREKVDVIICTGGLGVTDDDVSKRVIARYFNRDLVIGEQAKSDVMNWYLTRGLKMPPIAAGFMELPSDSRYLKNAVGIAPGAIIEDEELMLVLLPGPPSEMKPMLEIVVGYLASLVKTKFNTIYVKTFGIKEADAFLKLKDLIQRYTKSIQITTYCENMEVTIAVRYSSKVAKMSVDNVLYEIHDRLREYIYAEENATLEDIFSSLCALRKVKVSCAESLTGGEIASRIVKIPGASEFFYEGLVCYSNDSKVNSLSVDEETLSLYGAVSEQAAYEMAVGMLEKTGSDLVLVTTGIAGPGGGSEDKPVGLVYIGIGTKETVHIYKNQFYGEREEIIDSAVKTALFKAIQVIK